jgi:hypothetical protein
VTYRWDLLGYINALRQERFALLQRTLQIDILDLLTQIRPRVYHPDKPILDLQVDVGALHDILFEYAQGFDFERCTATDPKKEGQLCTR